MLRGIKPTISFVYKEHVDGISFLEIDAVEIVNDKTVTCKTLVHPKM